MTRDKLRVLALGVTTAATVAFALAGSHTAT